MFKYLFEQLDHFIFDLEIHICRIQTSLTLLVNVNGIMLQAKTKRLRELWRVPFKRKNKLGIVVFKILLIKIP